MSEKKLGRPTDNPRKHKVSIRLTDDSKEILEQYCQEQLVNTTEAVERGIKKLSDDLKK